MYRIGAGIEKWNANDTNLRIKMASGNTDIDGYGKNLEHGSEYYLLESCQMQSFCLDPKIIPSNFKQPNFQFWCTSVLASVCTFATGFFLISLIQTFVSRNSCISSMRSWFQAELLLHRMATALFMGQLYDCERRWWSQEDTKMVAQQCQ